MTTKRYTIGFDADALKVIEELRKYSKVANIAEVIRDALGLYDWAKEKTEEGYKIGCFKEAGMFTDSQVLEVTPFKKRFEK